MLQLGVCVIIFVCSGVGLKVTIDRIDCYKACLRMMVAKL